MHNIKIKLKIMIKQEAGKALVPNHLIAKDIFHVALQLQHA